MNVLHEPHLLSSYTPSSRSIAEDSFTVDITCVEYDHKGFATTSVQGDGVHVLEISEMRPVISHTLGPGIHFICPSISQIDESGTLSTFAITNTTNQGTKYWLRKWVDSLSENFMHISEQKSSPNFIENIHRIYTLPKWQSTLVVLSVSGHVYILSTESLSIDQFFRHTTSDSHLFRSFIFSPESCTFASQHLNSDGALLVRFFFTNNTLLVNLSYLSSSGLKEIASSRLCDREGVVDLTCSSSGYIMVLILNGTWRTFQLDEQGKIMKEVTSQPPSQSKDVTLKYHSFALASITSSFALLACIEGSANLHFVLWDLRFSVVLATQTFALPSNLTVGPKPSLQMTLVAARQTEAVILVSPFRGSEKLSSSQSRSAIFILPISISKTSSIALAMGKASDIPNWLSSSLSIPSFQEKTHRSLLDRIGAAIVEGLSDEADTIFFNWIEEETARGINTTSEDKEAPKLPKLSYRFVTTLLDMILQPVKASDVPYSFRIPLYLIERKAVSDHMVQGGFVFTLRRRGDWKSICVALQHMADIPEQEIASLLVKVLDNHKRNSEMTTGGGDAMDVEPSAYAIPSLETFLPMIVRYQLSSVAACYALKTSLSNVDDVILILQELDQMLETVCKQDLIKSPADSLSLPSLQSILSFMQYLLDAHFLKILQHLSTRPLLKQISNRLQENLTKIQEFDQLREPLTTVFRTRGSTRGVGSRENKKNSRKDSYDAVVGLYQVEELVL